MSTTNQVSWPIPEDAKTEWVNGYPLTYQDAGTGPALVLVHGAMNDYRIWYAQRPDFVKRHRVINVSLRHYYPERWNGQGGGFQITDQAEDVAALLRSLQLGRVHLLGHSRGGAVAINAARLHRELVRTLVLADASGLESLLPDTLESRKTATFSREFMARVRRTLATGGDELAAQEFVDALGGPGTWARRSDAERQVTLDNIGTVVGDTGERPPIKCTEIAAFDFPILLINGDRSPRRYLEMFAAMRACGLSIPPPLIIPNAAHSMNRENSAAFNTAVLEFLARN